MCLRGWSAFNYTPQNYYAPHLFSHLCTFRPAMMLRPFRELKYIFATSRDFLWTFHSTDAETCEIIADSRRRTHENLISERLRVSRRKPVFHSTTPGSWATLANWDILRRIAAGQEEVVGKLHALTNFLCVCMSARIWRQPMSMNENGNVI